MNDVHAVFANYPPEYQPTHVESLGSAGGLSGARFWRITVAASARDVSATTQHPAFRTFVLRRWPAEHPSPERLQFIHAVLRHAAAHGCNFLPLPVTTRDGQSFVNYAGHLWEVAPWLAGAADFDRSPSLEKLRAALRALAQFHNAVATFTAGRQAESTPQRFPSAIHRHALRLQELMRSEIPELARSIRDTTWPDLAPLARQFVATLPRAVPGAIAQLEPLTKIDLPLQPCLRDIWHDHILFTGDEVTGLVDFGAVDIDTPATDIARLLGSLAARTPLPFGEGHGEGSTVVANHWQEGLSTYNAIRSLSSDEIRAVYALDTSAPILAGCNWIRWIYIDGRHFDSHEHVVKRFQRICNTIASRFLD
jgi:Ser/Thr protein kinase RdoA (MazF antagonist)